MSGQSGVSHSRVEAYLSCKRKEFYSYARKLESVERSTPLALGTAGHQMLDVLYSAVLAGGNTRLGQRNAYPGAVKKMWEAVDELYANGWEDSEKRAPLRLILEMYLQQEPFIDNAWMGEGTAQWKILAVEKEFNLVWNEETGESYPFVIDLLVMDPEGRIVVVDNKMVYDLYSNSKVELMSQLPKYMGGLRALNYKGIANYAMYNMLRTRPEPKTKKRPLYEWAFAMEVPVTPTRVKRSFMEQIVASEEVAALDLLDDEERDLRAIRTNDQDTCERMCDFRDLCVEELRGGNTALLLAHQYQAKTKREKIEVSLQVED